MSQIRAASIVILLLSGGAGVAFAGVTQTPAPAATPAAPPPAEATAPALQERLARIRTELLSGSANLDTVVPDLKAILAIDPRAAEGHLLLGLAYRSMGSYPMLVEAIAEFRQAIALDARLLAVRLYLAHAYLDLDRPARAREESLLGLEKLPDQPQMLTLLAEAERRLGNPERTIELTRQVLARTPESTEARYYGANALFDLKRRDEAIREFEILVRTGVNMPDLYLRLGNEYIVDNRIDEATDMMVKAATLAPVRPDIRIALARTYRLKGLLDDAERQLAQAFPSSVQVEASSFYEQAQADLNREVGILRFEQKRLDEAVISLDLATMLRPADGMAHRYLAEVHAQLGNRDLAIAHMTRATDAGVVVPDHVRAAISGTPGADRK